MVRLGSPLLPMAPLAPGWPAAAERPGSPLLLGALQYRLAPGFPGPPSQQLQGPLPRSPGGMLTNTQQPVKVYTLKRTSSGTTVPQAPRLLPQDPSHEVAALGSILVYLALVSVPIPIPQVWPSCQLSRSL